MTAGTNPLVRHACDGIPMSSSHQLYRNKQQIFSFWNSTSAPATSSSTNVAATYSYFTRDRSGTACKSAWHRITCSTSSLPCSPPTCVSCSPSCCTSYAPRSTPATSKSRFLASRPSRNASTYPGNPPRASIDASKFTHDASKPPHNAPRFPIRA